MKFRCKGTGGKSHYSIQVQEAPRTRFVEVGQVWKEGSKWRTSADTQTWKQKKIAIAMVEGQECLRRMRAPDVPHEEHDQAEHARDMPGDGEAWPSWAKWPKGTILKSIKYGGKGPLESAHVHRGSQNRRYRIKVGLGSLIGTAKQFEEVKDD